MATINGGIAFDRKRDGSWTGSATGMNNVPITLQSTTANAAGLYDTLTIMPGSNGGFSFTNVPAGSYNIIEDYGRTPTAGTGTAAWSAATVLPLPKIEKSTSPPIQLYPIRQREQRTLTTQREVLYLLLLPQVRP